MRYVPRYSRFLSALLALASLAACEREGDGGQYAGVGEGGLRAIIVAPEETRTDFDSYVGKFTWSEGDKIAIHLSDGTFYETEVNAETGAFTCSTTATKKRDAYAVYPASVCDASNYGSPTLNVILPASYDITGNLSSDNSPVPMIAVNRQAEDDLYFRHVGGLLRITCDKVPVGTQKIAVTLPRNIAGTFAVTNPASENPTISAGGNSPTVTFQIAETALTERTDGIVLNLPVPVGTVRTLKVAALNASGAEIYADTRDVDIAIERYQGKKFISLLTEVFSDSMQLLVTANEESSYSFTFNNQGRVFPADITVLWGDGSMEVYSKGAGVVPMRHTYSEAGDYMVTVSAENTVRNGAMLPKINFHRIAINQSILKAVLTPLLKMENCGGEYFFEGCEDLEYICGDVFSKNPDITSLASAFSGCKSLTSIPEELFSYTPHVTAFTWVFSGCTGLTSIPARLFSENREAVYFDYAFSGCSSITGPIPGELFANNEAAKGFQGLFNNCSNISGSIPGELFSNSPAALDFYGVFFNCRSLTGSIPGSLFANSPAATTFTSTFRGCTGLTGPIPGDLFANNPAATGFSYTFEGCSSLSGEIPSTLFAANTAATTFKYTFSGCHALSGSIPGELFANNPAVTTFENTFNYCSGLSGSIPGTLFANNTAVKSFDNTFVGCGNLSGSIPGTLFANNTAVKSFNSTFYNCIGLSGPIPASLFANNTAVTSFNSTFAGCRGLNGPIPGALFANNPAVTSFGCTFAGCRGLNGPIPGALFANNPAVTFFAQVFDSCSGLNGSIPATLFSNNAAVVTFKYAFQGCTGLSGISSGLFDSNQAVTNFRGVFSTCSGLRGSIPTGLFDHCPEVTDFSAAFLGCSGLQGDMPHGLFAKNLKVNDFSSTFANCTQLKVVEDVFTDEETPSSVRFNSEWYRQYGLTFLACFMEIGGGTAPDIWNNSVWNYPFVLSSSAYAHCFLNSNLSNITNYLEIPGDWTN